MASRILIGPRSTLREDSLGICMSRKKNKKIKKDLPRALNNHAFIKANKDKSTQAENL